MYAAGEISLKANIYYHFGKDSVVGLEEFNIRQTSCHETNSISSGLDDRRAYLPVEAAS